MNDGKRLEKDDYDFAVYHLSEAISEISKLLRDYATSNDRVVRETHASTIAHAYNHLNWYWNGRKRTDKTRVEFGSDDELAEFSDFPKDLVVMLCPDFGKVRPGPG